MADEVVVPVEHKAFEFKIEGEYAILALDPNKDGEALLELKVKLTELPDEAMGLFVKKPAAAEAPKA